MAVIEHMDLSHFVGKKVGSAVLLKELGRGGMGVVFVAYQKTLKRQIAVKILPKSILTPSTARIFRREAEAGAVLFHPNIIPIYEVGEGRDFLFYSMQLVRGKSLHYYIQRAHRNVLPSRRTLPLKISLTIMLDVLDALDYAHRQDIIHRDIKPANILLEGRGNRPIITDFGVARVTRNTGESASMIVGTPKYMAPEQILNSDVDGRADIYAAGTMLLEMLSPEPLFQGIRSTQELLELKMKRKAKLLTKMPSQLNPKLTRDMDRLLLKALSFDPDERYATCQNFREQVKQYMEHHMTDDRLEGAG